MHLFCNNKECIWCCESFVRKPSSNIHNDEGSEWNKQKYEVTIWFVLAHYLRLRGCSCLCRPRSRIRTGSLCPPALLIPIRGCWWILKSQLSKTESQDGNVHYDNNKYENELFVFRAMSKDLLWLLFLTAEFRLQSTQLTMLEDSLLKWPTRENQSIQRILNLIQPTKNDLMDKSTSYTNYLVIIIFFI